MKRLWRITRRDIERGVDLFALKKQTGNYDHYSLSEDDLLLKDCINESAISRQINAITKRRQNKKAK